LNHAPALQLTMLTSCPCAPERDGSLTSIFTKKPEPSGSSWSSYIHLNGNSWRMQTDLGQSTHVTLWRGFSKDKGTFSFPLPYCSTLVPALMWQDGFKEERRWSCPKQTLPGCVSEIQQVGDGNGGHFVYWIFRKVPEGVCCCFLNQPVAFPWVPLFQG
jgi:hypothetical protein